MDTTNHEDIALDGLNQDSARDPSVSKRRTISKKLNSQVRNGPVDQEASDEEEVDVKKLKANFDETKQIMAVVKEFEEAYSDSKSSFNEFDRIQMETETNAKVLKHCFGVLRENLYQQYPEFDTMDVEKTIAEHLATCKNAMKSLCVLKGEFIQVNDTVINKDTFTMKIDMVLKARSKQQLILAKFEALENEIKHNQQKEIDLLELYEKFEKYLFSAEINRTEDMIGKTTSLMDEIDNTLNEMKDALEEVKQKIGKIVPQSKAHIKALQDMHDKVAALDNTLSNADETMDRHEATESKLISKHEENKELNDNLDHAMHNIVDVVNQSKSISQLVTNLKDWTNLFNALNKLKEDTIEIAQLDIQKIFDEANKLKEAVNGDRKDEEEDLMQQIRKMSTKNEKAAKEQTQRLIDFSEKIDGPEFAECIPDQDMLYLQKEITRYNASIEIVQAMRQTSLNEAEKLDAQKHESDEFMFSLNNINQLRAYLRFLEKQSTGDIPRIKKNIDALEAFCVKALKNKLNEDNKKSQAQISMMKKNYEDLQKEIDKLNGLLTIVKDQAKTLKDKYKDHDVDLEMDNDFKHKIDDVINDCDRDINGDKAERAAAPENKGKDRPLSLQARKKDIIAAINKMVNTFNDNNKAIKESSIKPKTEKEINDLIAKNKAIQSDCAQIDSKVTEGKLFAEQIEERLNRVQNPTIPDLEAKYDDKRALIDDCDDLDARLEEKIKNIEKALKDNLDQVEKICAKIDSASPIENPSKGPEKKGFVDQLSDFNEGANQLRDVLEAMQDRLQAAKDKREADVQPLCQLADRVVGTVEVQDVLEELKKTEAELDRIYTELVPLKNKLDDLEADVDKLLEDAKHAQIEEALRLLEALNMDIDNLGPLKKSAFKKLGDYKDLIADAQANEARTDPILANKLKQFDREASNIDSQLKDIESKEKDIKRKRDEAAKFIEAAFQNPDKFKPEQIDAIMESIQDQKQKVEGLNDKADQIEQDLDQRIIDLKALLSQIREKKQLDQQFKEESQANSDALQNIKDILKKLPDLVQAMIAQCEEMQKDTSDEQADYWDEKDKIKKWHSDLVGAMKALQEIKADVGKLEPLLKELVLNYKKATDNQICAQFLDGLKKLNTNDLLDKAHDVNDTALSIVKEIDDCQIPVNIKLRGKQLEILQEKIDEFNLEFKDLKQGDAAFEGNKESESKIKDLIASITALLKTVESEKRDHNKVQRKLEAYKDKEIRAPDNIKIITEIRELRLAIEATKQKLDQIEALLKDLNSELILQDMANATNLLEKKAKSLRERLTKANNELKQINKAGDDMDGNCTHNEEEEFIDALKDEMPEVFRNIENNFAQLDNIDDLIAKVRATKDIETMQMLKQEVDDSSLKVDQCENLVNKLENEIIEWDALKKLCRRDEELSEIDNLLNEFLADLNEEKNMMEKQLKKKETTIEKNPEDKEAAYLLEGINNYLDDIEKLNSDVEFLQKDKNACFSEFDVDVPSPVKEVRNRRMMNHSPNKKNATKFTPQLTESDKPTDMYYMLKVNCKYRQRIHDMLKALRAINQRRKDMEDKYAQLKSDLNAIPKERVMYVAVKGDAIDELWAYHLNKAQLDLPVIRTGPGKYIFGTRNITAKITNGKLMVRVGGGFMTADEFIAQYGQTEILKVMHNEEVREQQLQDSLNSKKKGRNDDDADGYIQSGRGGSPDKPKPRGSLIGNAIPMLEMKRIMQEQSKGGNNELVTGAQKFTALQSPKVAKRNTIAFPSDVKRSGSAGRNKQL